MVYITAVHMSATGATHEHIESVRWTNPSDKGTGESTRAKMVEWIRGGGIARVRDSAGNDVSVGVVNATPPYIRTHADGVWTDNLLSLPRY
jgi:hypothetical protein